MSMGRSETILFYAIAFALLICTGMYLYSLQLQLESLAEIVEKLEDRNVPQLTITGKYPYIEAKRGAIIVLEGEQNVQIPNRKYDKNSSY